MASSVAKDRLPAAAPAQSAPSSSSMPSSSAEDESRKKNTDCVYFLASPLTCKKGSECDYRHSEYARVNPRDCWYWLNGNCLNPKCSFRHPPLDALPGTPVDVSTSSSAPGSSLPATNPAHPAPYAAAKPTVPCVFFQKGYCLKGDLCPFSHMPNSLSKKTPEFHGPPSSGFSNFNSAPGELRKCSQPKPIPQANAPKPIEVTTQQPKANVHAVKALSRNGAFPEKHRGPPFISNSDFPNHKEMASLPYSNGNSRNKPGHAPHITALDEQRIQTRKETDDLQGESSPGFDVLVDDELGGSYYLRNEDQFPGIHGHEEGELSDRYRSLDDVEPVIYHDRYGYDNYDSKQEKHTRDRRYPPSDSHHDRTKNTDLRNRLSKQRRTDGVSSVVVSDSGYRSDRRESHGSSLSSRLQGRIKLPPSRQSGSEYDKGRSHARLSPTRPHRHGRIQERLRGRIQDEAFNFTRPRGLVERGEAFTSIGKRKAPESSQQATDDLSFEAPKPLSEILKRKRKTETTEENSMPPQPRENAAVAEPEANKEEETDNMNEDSLLAPTQEEDNEEGLVEDQGLNEGYEEEEQYDGEGEEGEAYEEGEGGEVGDEEYADEDDGDNFAKKIGVMFG